MKRFVVEVEEIETGYRVTVEYNKSVVEIDLPDLEDFSPFLQYFDKKKVELIKLHAKKGARPTP